MIFEPHEIDFRTGGDGEQIDATVLIEVRGGDVIPAFQSGSDGVLDEIPRSGGALRRRKSYQSEQAGECDQSTHGADPPPRPQGATARLRRSSTAFSRERRRMLS